MRKLLALLALTVPTLLLGQTPITVLNPSFEQPVTATYTETPPTGWKAGGNLSVGVENIGAVAPNGVNVAWINPSASLSQDLGTQAAGSYTLTFSLAGNSTASAAVTFGSCSQTFTGLTAAYTVETMTCTLSAAGDLSLSFADNSSQVTLDNVAVTLTAPPPPPPVFNTLTFSMQLVNCTLCDATDWAPLASASIYQGATIQLQQQPASGANQNICTATLNANAQASCIGPVNVQPASMTFIVTVTSPAGTLFFPPFAFVAPSLIVGGAPTGNIKTIIGFDATTSVPRAGFVYSQ